jgi:peptidoglycan hydrolase-like protein with peptidoglycan-binding domain
MNYYKNCGQFHTTPKVGDQIFFKNGTDITHTGLVYNVDNTYVYTIEGNTSNASGVVANGGGVRNKKYKFSYGKIAGYGRPAYSKEPISFNTYSILDWQKAAIADGFEFPKYGADGVWGEECEAVAKKAVCKKLTIGYKNKNLTRIVQRAVGVRVDGKFGNDTKNAVIKWQKLMGLVADGAVGINTWKKILGV